MQEILNIVEEIRGWEYTVGCCDGQDKDVRTTDEELAIEAAMCNLKDLLMVHAN